ncbi:MAG TPA: family 1 glycosylhydrolase [Kofleriaceae bacterium]|nr:family 1 glycosylhydrolase [Kofleriaceae bacterium]
MPSLAMWAGIECTVNRVGDRYFDQLVRTGHHDRTRDLDLIAELGIRTVRYPVIWERIAPRTIAEADWSWTDERLGRLRELGISPIVTLVHHGSGPAYTSLLDDRFPELLAEYARAVARRYPWITMFTPVNEPLTTARFSALYGHWYPHARDHASFVRAVMNQCKAITLAMRAIREEIPNAKLVTTEDLGVTRGVPELQYQIDRENERRWASMDLLCGQRRSVLGADATWFVENPGPPDIMGFNYYLTSERWLDTNVAAWPAWSHGGNGVDRYADIHAVLARKMRGIAPLLAQAWQRFGVPLAITEAHLGGTREEQMRWLLDIYDAANALVARGIPIRAMTIWSLFGCVDWNCLVTNDNGFYEPGAFDIRGPAPRPTALARIVSELAAGRRPAHPVLAGTGFWRRHAS